MAAVVDDGQKSRREEERPFEVDIDQFVGLRLRGLGETRLDTDSGGVNQK